MRLQPLGMSPSREQYGIVCASPEACHLRLRLRAAAMLLSSTHSKVCPIQELLELSPEPLKVEHLTVEAIDPMLQKYVCSCENYVVVKERLRSNVVHKWEIEEVRLDDGHIHNVKVNVEVMAFPRPITGTRKVFGGAIQPTLKTVDRVLLIQWVDLNFGRWDSLTWSLSLKSKDRFERAEPMYDGAEVIGS